MLQYYQVYSVDDPGLSLTFFTARSNLVPYAFVWKKGKTIDIYVPHRRGREHIVFGAGPVGVGVSIGAGVTLFVCTISHEPVGGF